ncbi:MAG TPA: hypothetical protein VL325_07160 [Pyrinomonadaceae bacterium]|nr:hypothetical protein [Pyrinomonadaceae bacterium]
MTNSKIFACLIVALITVSVSLAQKSTPDKPKFDVADFNQKFETARWLAAYDEVAWKTTDVVMTEDKTSLAKIGPEWFCFQDSKGTWHAIYGRFENGTYDLLFHYLMDATGKITKTSDKVDQGLLNTYAKSLVTARTRLMSKISPNSPSFNQYVRLNSDKSLDVWMLPAFQRDETAVYGGEGIYHIDSTGTKVISDSSYFQEGLRGFKTTPAREIWLNYRELEKPTLGSIFFVWYYKSYFTNIYIDNIKSTSTVVRDGNEYIWVHVEKDGK